jgi:hypothetical protein
MNNIYFTISHRKDTVIGKDIIPIYGLYSNLEPLYKEYLYINDPDSYYSYVKVESTKLKNGMQYKIVKDYTNIFALLK